MPCIQGHRANEKRFDPGNENAFLMLMLKLEHEFEPAGQKPRWSAGVCGLRAACCVLRAACPPFPPQTVSELLRGDSNPGHLPF